MRWPARSACGARGSTATSLHARSGATARRLHRRQAARSIDADDTSKSQLEPIRLHRRHRTGRDLRRALPSNRARATQPTTTPTRARSSHSGKSDTDLAGSEAGRAGSGDPGATTLDQAHRSPTSPARCILDLGQDIVGEARIEPGRHTCSLAMDHTATAGIPDPDGHAHHRRSTRRQVDQPLHLRDNRRHNVRPRRFTGRRLPLGQDRRHVDANGEVK